MTKEKLLHIQSRPKMNHNSEPGFIKMNRDSCPKSKIFLDFKYSYC